MATPERLAMFPLGTMVFPGVVIPLHIFEPRYQKLATDCLGGDATFGIVLITRGREVGGGDERAAVGTKVAITKAVSLADGRWLLMAEGQSRIRIAQWLDDDPYPLALVEDWPDAAEPVDAELRAQAITSLRRTRALLSETRESPALAAEVAFHQDPAIACWQLCAEAPVSVYDGQRLLAADSTGTRLRLLIAVLGELEDDLHRMLAE